jgi:hypothetical protein
MKIPTNLVACAIAIPTSQPLLASSGALGFTAREDGSDPGRAQLAGFIRGCIKYRQSLDVHATNAPRSDEPYKQ